MRKIRLPKIKDVAALVRSLKPTIRDEYRAYDEDETPGILLTVGCTVETGQWGWQSGDNSYSGGAYGHPYWGIGVVTRRCDSRQVAREIIDEIAEAAYQMAD